MKPPARYARAVRLLLARGDAAARTSTAEAIRAGRILEEMKRRLPYGDYTNWVIAECRFSVRMAWNYRFLWRTWGKFGTVAELPTIREAIAYAQRAERLAPGGRATLPPYPLKCPVVQVTFTTAAQAARFRQLLEDLGGPEAMLTVLEAAVAGAIGNH